MSGIFTIDSILSLVVMVTFLSASAYLLSEPKINTDDNLYFLGSDILISLHKNQGLEKAVSGDPEVLEGIFADLPGRFCFQINIEDNQSRQHFFQENDCGKSDTHIVSKRFFTHNNSIYIANLKMWYK